MHRSSVCSAIFALLVVSIFLIAGPVCAPTPPACGDGTCNGDETCETCPEDCGACNDPSGQTIPTCGDGTCNGDETCSSCPEDCGACPAECGDGICNGDETCSSCPEDCGACPAECGDGMCNGDETCSSCPADCGLCGGTGDTVTLSLGGGVTMDLVRIPAGTFEMGTNDTDYDWLEHSRPVHTVTISQPFYMGKYEVTRAQWQAVMGTAPWAGQIYTLDQDDAAGSYLSWDDAQAFCTAIQTQTGYAVRLPTEAEWEYACRAGSTTKYYFGDDASPFGDYAWFYDNAWDIDEKYAHPVGQKLPNAFGLYDMHGNVWEWCEDSWQDDYTGAPADGSAWTDGTPTYRVVRSGYWRDFAYSCRSAYRHRNLPSARNYGCGYRLSLDSN